VQHNEADPVALKRMRSDSHKANLHRYRSKAGCQLTLVLDAVAGVVDGPARLQAVVPSADLKVT
jgi:hypothetical protein